MLSTSFLYSQEGNCEMTKGQFDALYETSGKEHNEALSKVLQSLKEYENKDSKSIGAEELHGYVVNATGVSMPYNEETKKYLLNNHETLLDGVEVSAKFQFAIDKAIMLLEKEHTPEVLNKKFNILYNKYLSQISNCNEKIAFTTMLSIGKNSYEYWNQNYQEWEDLNGGEIAAKSD